jgi:hypothetical protein
VKSNGHGLICGATPHFLEGLEKITKITVRIVGTSAEIRTRHLSNISQKRYRLNWFVRPFSAVGPTLPPAQSVPGLFPWRHSGRGYARLQGLFSDKHTSTLELEACLPTKRSYTTWYHKAHESTHFYPDDGSGIILRNVGIHLLNYTLSCQWSYQNPDDGRTFLYRSVDIQLPNYDTWCNPWELEFYPEHGILVSTYKITPHKAGNYISNLKMKGVYSSEMLRPTNQNHTVSYHTRVHSYTENGGIISPETLVPIFSVS